MKLVPELIAAAAVTAAAVAETAAAMVVVAAVALAEEAAAVVVDATAIAANAGPAGMTANQGGKELRTACGSGWVSTLAFLEGLKKSLRQR